MYINGPVDEVEQSAIGTCRGVDAKRRRREDDPGTSSPRQLQGDDGCVLAGRDRGKTDGAEPGSAADYGREGGSR